MLGSCHTARRRLEVLPIDSNAETEAKKPKKEKPKVAATAYAPFGLNPIAGRPSDGSEMTARATKRIKPGGHRELQAEGAFNMTAFASSVNSR